jgi:uncharacterized damage-inducible protein DinB
MTTTTPASVTQGVTAMNWVRQMLTDMLATIPDDKLTHQPFPGANHALWIMGHVTVSDDYFLAAFANAGREHEDWEKTFGHGSTPSADAGDYPPADEVRSAMGRRRAALVAWIESMDAETLAEKMPDDWQTFSRTKGELPAGIGAHEGMHVGQLADVRKSLGMTPLMASE